MTRTRCINKIDNQQCKNIFRSRVNHSACRSCYRIRFGESRPIKGRDKITAGYRRTKNRRRGLVPKKVVVSKVKGKNKNQTSIE